jgi:hypothetical protein
LRRCGYQHLSCLVLYAPLAGRTLPAGEGGCAAGWLPPPHYLNNGPAVRCRSSPEFPFRFIWVLGRLVNVVSLAYKILTANHVLIMQPRGRTTDECSIRASTGAAFRLARCPRAFSAGALRLGLHSPSGRLSPRGCVAGGAQVRGRCLHPPPYSRRSF